VPIDRSPIFASRTDRSKNQSSIVRQEGTREVYRIYLTDTCHTMRAREGSDGIGASIERLIEPFVDWQFAA